MATIRVSRQFKEDFDLWAKHKIDSGEFSQEEMAEMKEMMRKDLMPGPDQLREGLTYINQAGVEVPAMIDDVNRRVELWTNFFADFANEIRKSFRKAA